MNRIYYVLLQLTAPGSPRMSLPLILLIVKVILTIWIFLIFQAKRNLSQCIDKFIQERIVLAGVAISETYARTKINDGDVILTYAWYVQLFNQPFCELIL